MIFYLKPNKQRSGHRKRGGWIESDLDWDVDLDLDLDLALRKDCFNSCRTED